MEDDKQKIPENIEKSGDQEQKQDSELVDQDDSDTKVRDDDIGNKSDDSDESNDQYPDSEALQRFYQIVSEAVQLNESPLQQFMPEMMKGMAQLMTGNEDLWKNLLQSPLPTIPPEIQTTPSDVIQQIQKFGLPYGLKNDTEIVAKKTDRRNDNSTESQVETIYTRESLQEATPNDPNEKIHAKVEIGNTGDLGCEKLLKSINVQEIGQTCSNEMQFSQKQPSDLNDRIQKRLIKFYEDQLCAMPLSMMDPSIDAHLHEFYVNPDITDVNKTKIRQYKDLLSVDNGTDIFLLGEPGVGKTTFSVKLTLDWCRAHDPSFNLKTKFIDDFFTDIETLREYTFLFVLPLRDLNGTECNTETYIMNLLELDSLDNIRKQRCLEFHDAADEWTHPSDFKPDCKCSDVRVIPYAVAHTNIKRITTSRPWKLARVPDGVNGRKLEMIGIHDPVKLTEQVVQFLNDKYHRDDRSAAEFAMMIAHAHLGRLMSKPVLAMQLIHQWYVGKFDNRAVSDADTSQLALYSNMVDMLLGHADKNKTADTDVKTNRNQSIDIPDYFDHFENIQDNKHLVISISNLAFNTLLKQNKQCSIVFDKETICKIINDHEMQLFLTAGILTQKQSIGLRSNENRSYMFLHKTLQEFLAALHMLISIEDNKEYMSLFKDNFNEPYSVLDCSQLFTFTCAFNPVLAERMSSCIMDVITADCHDRVERGVDPDFKLIENAQKLIEIGFFEGKTNGHSLSLTLTHFTIGGSSPAMSPFGERPKMDMLLRAANCRIKSLNVRSMHHDTFACTNLQMLSAMSKDTMEFLAVRDIHLKLFDLTKLKYLFVCRNSAYYEMVHLPVNFTEVQNKIADEFVSTMLPQLSLRRVVLYWIQVGDKSITLPKSLTSICLYDVGISEGSRRRLTKWTDENNVEFQILDKIEFL